MVKHLDIVAVLMGGWSAFQLLMAVTVGLLIALAGGVVGAAGAAGGEEEVMIIGGVYAVMGVFVLGFAALLAIPGLIAAYGIHGRKSWGRILGMIVAALACMSFPIGTAIGVYTLIVLLDAEVADAFASEVA